MAPLSPPHEMATLCLQSSEYPNWLINLRHLIDLSRGPIVVLRRNTAINLEGEGGRGEKGRERGRKERDRKRVNHYKYS